jgi:CheY-like chemotaxis protein/HPt (histidine-containing phosphotransfer) domain-containing protein
MLQKLGLSVDIAVDGRRAIESLTSAHYDAVLMDCQMPEMDGYEVTRVVRALEAEGKLPRRRQTRLPIIAMTAHSHGSTMSQCLSAGMDDFLTKPVNGAALRTVLAKWLHVGVTATPGAVASGPHEPELPTRSTAEPALDAAALATMRELMGDGFDELVAMMLADAPARIAAMRIALATNDYAALRMAVHTLKSASANVSALMLSGMCEQLERRLGTSGEEGVASRVDAIDAEYTRVASALRGLRGGDG